jgi:hypothetical protein
MDVVVNSLGLLNQALTNLAMGFTLALVNVLLRYMLGRPSQIISILRWRRWRRALLVGYLIALVLQVATAPIFRSMFQSVYAELAWSPYQALFNVLGILLMDVILRLVQGVKTGAQAGRDQVTRVQERTAATVAQLRDRRQGGSDVAASAEIPEAETAAARQERLRDRLNDY